MLHIFLSVFLRSCMSSSACSQTLMKLSLEKKVFGGSVEKNTVCPPAAAAPACAPRPAGGPGPGAPCPRRRPWWPAGPGDAPPPWTWTPPAPSAVDV